MENGTDEIRSCVSADDAPLEGQTGRDEDFRPGSDLAESSVKMLNLVRDWTQDGEAAGRRRKEN
jgi:hypothetical protein